MNTMAVYLELLVLYVAFSVLALKFSINVL